MPTVFTIFVMYSLVGLVIFLASILEVAEFYVAILEEAAEKQIDVDSVFLKTYAAMFFIYVFCWPWILVMHFVDRNEQDAEA